MVGSDELCMMTAGEALAAFRARRLSPVELMQAVIARVEQVNPTLNAFTYTFFERALAQARRAEAKYLKSDGRPRPLEGIPVAIKDLHPVKGEITTFGSKAFADNRPDHTAPTVERLLRAGAILHARTTTPESPSGTTYSALWGVTRNPWNTAYSPGGSSGGAGAALATGMTMLADGTDAGGSIRIPASACGLVGYKPPFGRNPLDRDFPRETILHFGPLTRAVGDAALMQNVMSGPHAEDPCSLRTRVRIPENLAGIEGWRVAVSLDLGYKSIDPEVERNTRAAADVFRGLGCDVEDVALGWHSGVLDAFLTHSEALYAGMFGHLLPRWRFEMDPFLVDVIERGMRLDAARAYRVNLVRGEMYRQLSPILDKYHVLICPTLAVPSVPIEHNNMDYDLRIGGTPVQPHLGWLLTYPFNLVGECPVMSVPSGFCRKTGVPTGIQIVGRSFDDLRVFRAAAAYEKASPWRGRWPAL